MFHREFTPVSYTHLDVYKRQDFKSYAAAQERVEAKYRNEAAWARSAILNTACAGKFSSDRTIQEYVDDIWKLERITVK